MVRLAALALSLGSLVGCFVDTGAGGTAGGEATSGGATSGGATSGGPGSTSVGATGAAVTETGVGSTSEGSTGVATTTGEATTGEATSTTAVAETTGGPVLPGCLEVKMGPIACYRFESSANGKLLDDSPFLNHANAAGVTLVPGVVGTAIDMTKVSQVVAPSGAHLAPGQEMTWSAWVRVRSLPPVGQRRLILDKPAQIGLIVRAGGASCSTTGFQPLAEAPLELETWTHLACVHAADNSVTIYRDGVLLMTEAGGAIGPDSLESLVIGNDGPTPTLETAFDGAVDELRIWGRALTAAEVALEAGLGP